MSTDLKPTEKFHLVRFSGKLQITDKSGVIYNSFIVVDKKEAMELAIALLQYVEGTRPEED